MCLGIIKIHIKLMKLRLKHLSLIQGIYSQVSNLAKFNRIRWSNWWISGFKSKITDNMRYFNQFKFLKYEYLVYIFQIPQISYYMFFDKMSSKFIYALDNLKRRQKVKRLWLKVSLESRIFKFYFIFNCR